MTSHGGTFVSAWVGVQLILLVILAFWPRSPAHAHLVPAPDTVQWRVGQERTVWVETNVQAVELRVHSIDLGLGDIARLDQAQAATLGRATGCLDSAVSSITADHIDDTSAIVTFTIDYGSRVAGETLTVYHRIYEEGQTPGEGLAGTVDVAVPATGLLTGTVSYTSLHTGVRQYIEASTSQHFPHEATHYISFVPEDGGAAVVVTGEDDFHLAAGTGIGLIGCHEDEDVLVTLHSGDGKELQRYVVDVQSAPPPTPAPTPTPAPPGFPSGHVVARVAVVDVASRDLYFAGGESVATVAATGGTSPVTYSLAPGDGSLAFVFFDVDQGTGAVTVSAAGADDHAGLEVDQIYTFEVRVEDANGLGAHTGVAIQVVRP